MKYLVFNDERPQNFDLNNAPYLNKTFAQKVNTDKRESTTIHEFIPNKYPPDVEFAKNHGVFFIKIKF